MIGSGHDQCMVGSSIVSVTGKNSNVDLNLSWKSCGLTCLLKVENDVFKIVDVKMKVRVFYKSLSSH